MNKLAIVYWSGTGNTETMANCIADGARESGAEVAMLPPGEFSATRFSEFGVVAFGCPAMGAEQLEEDEVEPMFAGLEDRPVRFLRLGRRPMDAGVVQPLRGGGR